MSIITDGFVKDPVGAIVQNVQQTIVNNVTAPVTEYYYEIPVPSNGDKAGEVLFSAKNSAGQKTQYAKIAGLIVDKTDGEEDGAFDLRCLIAGTQTRIARFDQNFAAKSVCIEVKQSDQDVAVADGKDGFCVPSVLNGWNLVAVTAANDVAGSVSGTTDIQVRRARAGADVDMLSSVVSIPSGDYTASTVAGSVNGDNDDLQTGDLIYIDVDAVAGTAPKGLSVTLSFRIPDLA